MILGIIGVPLLLSGLAAAQDDIVPLAKLARPREYCIARGGCLLVINHSENFQISELYVNDGERDKANQPRWRENQFAAGYSISPRRAWWAYRPHWMRCKLSVRAVLRDVADSKRTEVETTTIDICDERNRIVATVGLRDRGAGTPTVTVENALTP